MIAGLEENNDQASAALLLADPCDSWSRKTGSFSSSFKEEMADTTWYIYILN